MYLTPFQRKVLEHYRRHREKRPTLLRLLKQALPNHLVLILVFGLGAAFVQAIGAGHFALLLLGMAIGTFLRDLGTFRRFAQLWPVLVQILDWHQIDQLLGDRLDSPIIARSVSASFGDSESSDRSG